MIVICDCCFQFLSLHKINVSRSNRSWYWESTSDSELTKVLFKRIKTRLRIWTPSPLQYSNRFLNSCLALIWILYDTKEFGVELSTLSNLNWRDLCLSVANSYMWFQINRWCDVIWIVKNHQLLRHASNSIERTGSCSFLSTRFSASMIFDCSSSNSNSASFWLCSWTSLASLASVLAIAYICICMLSVHR